MSENWAEAIAERIAGTSSPLTGKLLLLGAADTGKTTLLTALARRLSQDRPVALVDADVGQSHIGPPTTVGWTLIHGQTAVAEHPARGIAFVGDITPVGHLLQLTAALTLCVEQASQAAEVILIDTPGLVTGGAACTLWWTVQRLLRPQRIVAVQRENELGEVLRGLHPDLSAIEIVQSPAQMRRKSPQARQERRHRLFARYFQNAAAHKLDLRALAIRTTYGITPANTPGRLVGLSDVTGQDIAIGVIEQWRQERANGIIVAPQMDVQQVRCVTIGEARIAVPLGWS